MEVHQSLLSSPLCFIDIANNLESILFLGRRGSTCFPNGPGPKPDKGYSSNPVQAHKPVARYIHEEDQKRP